MAENAGFVVEGIFRDYNYSSFNETSKFNVYCISIFGSLYKLRQDGEILSN